MSASVRRFSDIANGGSTIIDLDQERRYPPGRLTNHNPGVGAEPRQQPQHRRLGHRNASRRGAEILAHQMQEHRTASAGNSWRAIVIDLDDKVIEVVVSFQTVATAIFVPPHRPVVVAALRVFAPGVFRTYGANR